MIRFGCRRCSRKTATGCLKPPGRANFWPSFSLTGTRAPCLLTTTFPSTGRMVVGAAKVFDTADFVSDMRDFNVTPHVAQNTTNRLSAIDVRTIRHCGYEVSQQKRKRVEEPFGWGKTIGGLARAMLRGVKKLDFKFTLTMAAYDLIKLPRLIGATA